MHCHVRVIPRYAGDTGHPRGGILDVIPHKREY
jgi:diadenosine tetraphosphate (Ap4A) HIT family hydrolase